MMLRLAIAALIALPAAGCAIKAQQADAEVKAVVLDENARQAAAQTARATGDSEAALDAGKDAADQKPSPTP